MASKAKAAAIEDVEEEGTGGAPEQAKKKFALPPLKYLLIGAGALVVIGGGGGAAYYYLFGASSAESKAAAAVPVVKPAVFVDLPEVLVNLSHSGGDRNHYLKVKIVLELPDQNMIQQIQPIMPRVMDAFQTYLRELRASDLDGSAGLYRLKEELTRRVNISIAPNRVNAVLFKEIVVQ
jgi:flagellar protein FliL